MLSVGLIQSQFWIAHNTFWINTTSACHYCLPSWKQSVQDNLTHVGTCLKNSCFYFVWNGFKATNHTQLQSTRCNVLLWYTISRLKIDSLGIECQRSTISWEGRWRVDTEKYLKRTRRTVVCCTGTCRLCLVVTNNLFRLRPCLRVHRPAIVIILEVLK